MLSMPTNLAAYRHQKQVEVLNAHLQKCYSATVFFASAYFEYYECLDRYEVQCCLEKYARSGEIPDFVLAYLARLQ